MLRAGRTLLCLLALSGATLVTRAEEPPPPPPPSAPPPPPPPESAPAPASADKLLSEGELEQLVAPIALYPDDLVAQVLMASTYPLEIVEAARWAKKPENAKLKGDALDNALKQQSWDPSVKSIVPFPQVLQNMDEKLDWTQKLGDAVLAQQKDVMDAIQRLRKRAQDTGNLKSNEQQKVTTESGTDSKTGTTTEVIVIQPANPQVVYVPTYQPTVVYGTWPYPAYPPYYYPAPPGAYFASGFFWGAAITAGLYYGFGGCGWHGGDIDVDVNKNVDIKNEYNRNNNNNRGDRGQGDRGQGNRGQGNGKWNHDPSHRKGVNYGNASTRDKYGRGQTANASTRDQYRGRDAGGAGNRPSTGMGGDRPGAGGSGARAPGLGTTQRPQAGSSSVGASSRASAGSRDTGGAFDRSGGGSSARASSARGSSSMGGRSGGGSRGGGGGARGGGGGARGGGGGGRRR